jgi:glucose-6-phosphate 1-dehydrogenase
VRKGSCGAIPSTTGMFSVPLAIATFRAPRNELKDAQRPAHYLAIPPLSFEEVVEQLVKTGCLKGARLIIEKPFATIWNLRST